MERNLYNEEFKKKFVNAQYTGRTNDYYIYVLSLASKIEENFGKDLYEFNDEEYDILLSNIKTNSLNSLISINIIYSKYVEFAMSEGLVKHRINYPSLVNPQDLKTYVGKIVKEKRYINTREDFEIVIGLLYNPQDRALFGLLYEGVKGANGIEELQNLKKTDCNITNNTLTLTRDNGTQRQVVVSEYTMELIQEAIEDNEYYKNNGDGDHLRNPFTPLAQTEYVLRPSGIKKINKVTQQGIIRRINNLKEWFDYPFISITNIWVSGQIAASKNKKEELGRELSRQEYIEIAEKFGFGEAYWFNIKRSVIDYI